jgi:hypothetical protein
VVTSTKVIEPEELHVLAPTAGPALTLVTCYPFYFVGSAPQRFIVRAVPRSENNEDARGASGQREEDNAALRNPQPVTGSSSQPSTTNEQQLGGMHQ